MFQGRRGFGASGRVSTAKAAEAEVLEVWTAECRPLLLKTLRNLCKKSHAISDLSNVHVCSQALLAVYYSTVCLFTQRTTLEAGYGFSLKS